MRRFFENKPIVILIAATIIVLIIIGACSAADREISVAENAGGIVTTPAQGAVSGIGRWFSGITGYFGNVNSLKEENERLKSENTSLQKQVSDMQGLNNENERLKKMLDLREKSVNLSMTAASVAANDPSSWYSAFTINKGSGDGIEKNQPVVDADRYLIGQISEVGENWAKVITILDPQSSVGGFIRRSKEIGIVEGNSDLRYEGKCRLGYIARDTDIRSGDFVETSGLGGIFPKGLIIGKIIDIYDENSTMSKAATIEPLANIAKVNEVFVITSYQETDLSYSEPTEDEEDTDESSGDSGSDDEDSENE